MREIDVQYMQDQVVRNFNALKCVVANYIPNEKEAARLQSAITNLVREFKNGVSCIKDAGYYSSRRNAILMAQVHVLQSTYYCNSALRELGTSTEVPLVEIHKGIKHEFRVVELYLEILEKLLSDPSLGKHDNSFPCCRDFFSINYKRGGYEALKSALCSVREILSKEHQSDGCLVLAIDGNLIKHILEKEDAESLDFICEHGYAQDRHELVEVLTSYINKTGNDVSKAVKKIFKNSFEKTKSGKQGKYVVDCDATELIVALLTSGNEEALKFVLKECDCLTLNVKRLEESLTQATAMPWTGSYKLVLDKYLELASRSDLRTFLSKSSGRPPSALHMILIVKQHLETKNAQETSNQLQGRGGG